MSNRISLAVGIPAYGDSLTAHHARMWMELGHTLSASEERFGLGMFMTVDVNPIDRARNMLLAHAMRAGCNWLLMVDADTWVEAIGDDSAGVQLLRMISDADRADAAIVCAATVRRRTHSHEPTELMIYRQIEDSPKPDRLESIPFVDLGRRLVPIDACATAVIAINTLKIAEISPPLFFEFDRERKLSEDLNFCRAVRDAGGKIFCDGRVKTGHKSRAFALYNTASEQ
jgi:hypothetical protein